jgi:hypothetical protein
MPKHVLPVIAEIYGQFGHTSPVSFASPDLGCLQYDPFGLAILVLAACKAVGAVFSVVIAL